MKLLFEPHLDHQERAISAVTGLFAGARREQGVFTVLAPRHGTQASLELDDTGYANRVHLPQADWLANLRTVQRGNGLLTDASLELPWEGAKSGRSSKKQATDESRRETLEKKRLWDELGGRIFTVEMETGTGKTYVYLRTIYELHKQFGLSKFVIVIPSVAIKEGVQKSIAIMREHLASLYDGVTPEDFVYDGGSVERVRSFATSSRLQIMVLGVAAFNKDANVMNNAHEAVGGARPIDVLAGVRPVVIVDEPQSVEGGEEGKGLAALLRLRPLCVLRYSATPKKAYHRIFRLDAVEAYQSRLVKRIEVAAATLLGTESRPYVRLLAIKATSTKVTARAEIQLRGQRGTRLVVRELRENDDLGQLTGLAHYNGYRVGEIRRTPKAEPGHGTIALVGHGAQAILAVGEEHGSISETERARHMIRRTIREHLDKELALVPRGIKVLSLFFVGRVDDYRTFGVDGSAAPGELARIFEEEYGTLRSSPKYATLLARRPGEATSDVHDGYFSVDRRGTKEVWVDTKETSQTGRAASERAYKLIMRDKERLLSLETPLRFIFSHSALREGWDNPNVFQICALREMASESQRRQTLGRGLRLAVDQSGGRVREDGVNRLTVIAWESYESFAEGLQKEIESETGYTFGRVTEERLLGIARTDEHGNEIDLGEDRARELLQALHENHLVDKEGGVTEELRKALDRGTLELPVSCQPFAGPILKTLKQLASSIRVTDADERQERQTRRAVLDSEAFQALWARISQKTFYRVAIDEEKLVAACAAAVAETPAIRPLRVEWSRGDIQVGTGGVSATAAASQDLVLAETVVELAPRIPDLLAMLEEETKLTRRTLCRILLDSGRLGDVRVNPQQFVDQAKMAIRKRKETLITEGIVYRRLFDEVYAQEIFEELGNAIRENLVPSERSPHDFVEVDSQRERDLVEQLEREASVKVYVKLPPSFKIPTPLGTYNPDWALVIERDGVDRVYFVVETKSTPYLDELRRTEAAKVACAKRHFEALREGDNPARYQVVTTLGDLLLE